MINSGGCLIDPPGRQPTLSLDRPPEAEDGGSQLTAPEIHSTSGLDDSSPYTMYIVIPLDIIYF